MQKRKIGVLNSGGDVPGLNAVIASVVKAAHQNDMECIGFMKGLEGLISPNATVELNLQNAWEITGRGGTILKSVNKGNFPAKVAGGVMQPIDMEILGRAKAKLDSLGIDSLIVIGGDGTLSSATQLIDIGVKVVGVPKTVDNDLQVTDKTFGFSTAVDIITESIDRLRTTASSHDRVFVVETMGRNAGWLALYGGVAAEAEIILLPEFPFDLEKVLARLRHNRALGKNYQIVVVAEGAQMNGKGIYKVREGQENLLGGVSATIVEALTEMGDEDMEMRNLVLGHLQRGGSPNSADRILAQRFGVAAVNAIVNNEFGKMVALQGDSIVNVDIKSAVAHIKLVEENFHLVKTAKSLGISFGNEE